MTPEQINIAIAESLGWKKNMGDWYRPNANCQYITRSKSDGGYTIYPPNYCNDLNAMHEAEKSITDPRKMLDYFNHLSRYNDPDARSIQDSFNIITATAAQRAEAYLRTIGKWND